MCLAAAFNPSFLPIGSSQTFTLTGGTGLNLSPTGDKVALVDSSIDSNSCEGMGEEQHSGQVTDLGPDNTASATQATATFTLTQAGNYLVCYKPSGAEEFERVNGEGPEGGVLSFIVVKPTSFSPTEGTVGKLGWLCALFPQCLNGGNSVAILAIPTYHLHPCSALTGTCCITWMCSVNLTCYSHGT